MSMHVSESARKTTPEAGFLRGAVAAFHSMNAKEMTVENMQRFLSGDPAYYHEELKHMLQGVSTPITTTEDINFTAVNLFVASTIHSDHWDAWSALMAEKKEQRLLSSSLFAIYCQEDTDHQILCHHPIVKEAILSQTDFFPLPSGHRIWISKNKPEEKIHLLPWLYKNSTETITADFLKQCDQRVWHGFLEFMQELPMESFFILNQFENEDADIVPEYIQHVAMAHAASMLMDANIRVIDRAYATCVMDNFTQSIDRKLSLG